MEKKSLVKNQDSEKLSDLPRIPFVIFYFRDSVLYGQWMDVEGLSVEFPTQMLKLGRAILGN